MPSIHAEHDAINKLPFSRKKKTINMLVVRLTNNGFTNSKPCSKCVNMMCNMFPNKGYCVKKIYYSSVDGTINKTTLHNISKIIAN